MSENNMQNSDQQNNSSPFLIPGAIVIAGIFIALAIILTNQPQAGGATGGSRLLEAQILPVTNKDHVRGPRNADVFLVEYSDYKCVYCARFHATVMSLLEDYEGKLAWVYRHTPYQPGGKEAAVASECIAELAGEDAFWQYTDLALNNQSAQKTEWHISTAVELGANKEQFEECLSSDRYDNLIREQTSNSQELGGQGTPHNVLLTRKGDMLPFPGAQPKEQVAKLIDRALGSL